MCVYSREDQMFRGRTLQRGHGISMYRAPALQRGHGIGGVFSSLFRTVTPMLKRGLLHVGKNALNAGARALKDVSENNTTIKEALKKEAVNTFHPRNLINRSAVKRKRTSSTKTLKQTLHPASKKRRKNRRKSTVPDNI